MQEFNSRSSSVRRTSEQLSVQMLGRSHQSERSTCINNAPASLLLDDVGLSCRNSLVVKRVASSVAVLVKF